MVFSFQQHEADPVLRNNNCLSFEGFARFLMDKDNYAYIYEKTRHNDEVMVVSYLLSIYMDYFDGGGHGHNPGFKW